MEARHWGTNARGKALHKRINDGGRKDDEDGGPGQYTRAEAGTIREAETEAVVASSMYWTRHRGFEYRYYEE